MQLQHLHCTVPTHFVPHHAMSLCSYRIVSLCMSFRSVSFCVVPGHFVSFRVIRINSGYFVSLRVISCHFVIASLSARLSFVSFVSFRVISCHCVSFRVISCHFVIVCLSARLGQICHCHCVPFGTSWSGLSLSLHAFRHVLVRFVIVIAALVRFVIATPACSH